MYVEEGIFTFNQLLVLVLHNFFIQIYYKVLDRYTCIIYLSAKYNIARCTFPITVSSVY